MRAQAWAVIYGEDGRTELYAVANEKLRNLARTRAIAIVRSESLVIKEDEVSIDAPTVGEFDGLCSGERFAAQPAAAVCSGVLVDAQTVLTAGHCLRGAFCDEMRLVLGYFNQASDELAKISKTNVFTCAGVLASALSLADDTERLDYAWLRLDHPAQGIDGPLAIRSASAPLETGEPVILAGFSSGAPLKIDETGFVVDPRAASHDYFLTTVDSFDGNSGSAVLDERLRLVGVQNRGGQDYWPTDAGCNEIASEPGDGSIAMEQATYASRAFEGLCKAAPESNLCCSVYGTCDLVVSRSGCAVVGAPGIRKGRSVFTWIGSVIIAALAMYALLRLRSSGTCRVE